MFKVPYAQLREKLIASGKITPSELDNKIKAKINDLSGLISEEGAAHIIANELGIQIAQSNDERLKVKEIMPGMRNVNVAGKIVKKYDIREFTKGETKGKVGSLLLGDETGSLRVVFWNDQVTLFNDLGEGDIIIVKEGYVKENAGGKEVHIGDRASVEVNPQGVEISSVRTTPTAQRKTIAKVEPDEQCELFGTVVQIFDPRYWSTCPTCNKKVVESSGAHACNEHGQVTPGIGYVMNAVIDDGTGNIRCVFWKQQTNSLTNRTEPDYAKIKENPSSFEEIKTELLGEQIKLVGKVQKNDMFARLEFNVSSVERARPEDELKRLEK